jgi:hypothetical protein
MDITQSSGSLIIESSVEDYLGGLDDRVSPAVPGPVRFSEIPFTSQDN